MYIQKLHEVGDGDGTADSNAVGTDRGFGEFRDLGNVDEEIRGRGLVDAGGSVASHNAHILPFVLGCAKQGVQVLQGAQSRPCDTFLGEYQRRRWP